MNNRVTRGLTVLSILFLGFTSCKNQKKEHKDLVQSTGNNEDLLYLMPGPDNLVEVTTTAMDFQVSDTLLSGWTTFRYYNKSPMVHFFNLRSLPVVEGEQKRVEDAYKETIGIFRDVSKAVNEGNSEEASRLLKELPPWFYQQVSYGGVGLLSSGKTGQSVSYLEPGVYLMECYIRTGGIWHGELGMFKEVIVKEEKAEASPPDPTVAINISDEKGIEVNEKIQQGPQVLEVNIEDGTGNLHLIKLNEDSNLEEIEPWMSWRNPGGFETPAPAGTFVGGLASMKSGRPGYIMVDISPGEYALLSEGVNLSEKNLIHTFTVPEN